MKKIIFFLLVSGCLTILACKKKSNKDGIVIRDCTGTYIRYQDKDYQVSNIDKVSSFSDNAKVKVTFKQLKNYDDPNANETKCKMLHYNEGWIEVKKIE